MRRGMARGSTRGGKSKQLPPPPPPSKVDIPPAEAAPSAFYRSASLPAPTPTAPPLVPSLALVQEEIQSDPSEGGEPENKLTCEDPAQLEDASASPSLLQQPVGRQPCGMRPGDVRTASFDSRGLHELKDWQRSTLMVMEFFTRPETKRWLFFTIVAVAVILHWHYISMLFEHDRNFSHLSTLEKEMSFRTEMALYYSYFKTIIEAPTFWKGLWLIMNDKLTEFPLVINALKKFNLYPEVVLALSYRISTGIMDALGSPIKECWTVSRGEGLSSVESCEGWGDPAYFYVQMVFVLNALIVFVFFMYGVHLSESKLGGLLTVACYFFNHGESTRVMWTPPLRESFSYPFLVGQMYLLTDILRAQNVKRRSLNALFILNVLFILPWQFAQFVLLTQVISIFVIYVLRFIDSQKLLKILSSYMASQAVCFVLTLGNCAFLTSLFTAFVVVSWVIIRFRYLEMHTDDIPLRAFKLVVSVIAAIILKSLICLVIGESDDYLFHLLKAKFTGYRDFDTSMNTCAAELDFIGYEVVGSYLNSLLLPVVLFIFIEIVVKTYQYIVHSETSNERQESLFYRGEIAYHAVQLIFFTILAVLIMKLKLLLTPHMCIMASLIGSKQLFGWLPSKVSREAIGFALLAMMTFPGLTNIQKELSIVGEYSDIPQEELLLWIKDNTKQGAVFAGIMHTMPIVKMSAIRPIVNHPILESADSRARTKIVYMMYSRKPAEEVKKELKKLGINYYILENYWCLRKTGPGCSLPEIWDLEDLANVRKTPLCSRLSKGSKPHFQTVFQNRKFQVLEVLTEPSEDPSE